jgi:UDP-N-acetylmuramoylalanine--D-glutamate ligase
MDVVVTEAAALAAPGDVVLLAPAAASMDMFANYGARGDAFAEAVRRHASRPGGPSAS